ncbi:1615_t:CDS:2 [Entrophospora sp. SA101]|nr:1615_t:CDS:2 [Entrophospora sp. SA101]
MYFCAFMQNKLIEKRKIGDVVFLKFESGKKCSGTFHFTQIKGDTTRVTGQVNTGFTSPDPDDYRFRVVDKNGNTKRDFTSKIRSLLTISPPGTAAIEFDQKFQARSLVGNFFTITRKGKEFCRAKIKIV